MTCYKVKAVLLSQEEILTPGFVRKQDFIAKSSAQFFSLRIRIPSHKIRNISIYVSQIPVQMTAAGISKYFVAQNIA